MKTNQSRLIVVLFLLLIVSLACVAGGGEPGADDNAAVIATSVASTLAAGDSSGVPITPTEYPTVHPTITAGPPPANFSYNGISFFYNPTLADDITAGVTPGIQGEEMPWKTPDHREYRFNGWVLADTFHSPAIKIYSVAEFRAVNDQIGDRLDALQLALDTRPIDHAGLGIPTIYGAGQLFQSNVVYLDFQNGQGARWLSQYGQAYFPIGWPKLFYTFQGFTEDGEYFVSMILPVSHPNLPHPDDVELNDAFAQNYETYRAEIADQLEGEQAASFIPSLELLDEIVVSLLVESP